MMEEVRKRMKEIGEELEREFSELEGELRRLVKAGLVSRQELEGLRGRLRELRKRFLAAKVELRAMLSRARLAGVPSEVESLEEEVESFLERWDDSLEDFAEVLRDVPKGRGLKHFFKNIGRELRQDIYQCVAELETSLAGMREALEMDVPGPSLVISSIRLSQRDVKVIDALVEAGVFKSRGEAVAFFVRKGVESSRPALEEVLSKLEELKKLGDRLREELNRASGGESGQERWS